MNQDSLNNTGDNVSNKDVYEISESSVMNQANNNIYNLESVNNDNLVNTPDIVEEKEEIIYDLSDASTSGEVGVSVSSISNANFNQVEDTFMPEATLVLDESHEDVGKVVDKVVEVTNTIEERMNEATLIIDEAGHSRNVSDELNIAGLDRTVHEKEIAPEEDVAPENYVEELSKIYVGENYDDLVSSNINVGAFIFSYFYVLYRKMFFIPFFSFIICTIIFILTDLWFVYLVPGVIFGVLFNKLYSFKVKWYLSRYKNKINTYKYSELKKKCGKDGGVSFGFSFLCLLLFIVIIFGSAFLLAKNGSDAKIVDVFKIVGYDISELYKDDPVEIKNKQFVGVLMANQDVNVYNVFDVNVDAQFNNSSEKYFYFYEYYSGMGEYDKCEFSLFSPVGYVDEVDLANQMKEYYSEGFSSEVEKVNVSGIEWNKLYYTSSNGLTYVYLSKVKDNVYILEYNIQNNSDINCSVNNENILNNISLK